MTNIYPLLHSLVETYGYYALLVGTFFEGETILLIGGLVARLGYLDLSVVMLVAFAGSFSGDQLYFFLGRVKGRELLARHRKWEKRVEKVHCLMERYHDLIMVGFRFVYGIRILTPLVLGMNRSVKTGRFILFNSIGAVIWSIAVSSGGYFFGYAIEKLIHNVKDLELAVLAGILGVGITVLAVRKFGRKKC